MTATIACHIGKHKLCDGWANDPTVDRGEFQKQVACQCSCHSKRKKAAMSNQQTEPSATVSVTLSNGFRLTAELSDDAARRLMHSIPAGSRITKHRPPAQPDQTAAAR